MSMSRIIMGSASASIPRPLRRASPAARPGPCAREDPARPARVVAQLVALPGGALDREVAQHRLPFAAAPLPGHLAHPDDSPLPPKTQRLDAAFQKRSDHVDRIAQRFEHVEYRAPPAAYCT